MAGRALIIAIQDYSNSGGILAKQLAGTNAGAALFRDWLIANKKAEPADILCCAGPEFPGRTAGTTRSEIKAEIRKLIDTGRGATEELYLFFSGHGFSVTDSGGRPVDVLVTSDFTDLAGSGDACLRLQEIQTKLWNSLGPGDHYYFIDACRTLVQESQIEVTKLGFIPPPSEMGKPTYYTLFSTAQGEAAKVASGFAEILVQGLKGGGRAKGWRANRMYVIFNLLCEYVEKRIKKKGQEIDSSKDGNGDGLIFKLDPIPQSDCEIKVENADPADQFTLRVAARGLDKPYQFQGSTYKLTLAPDEYSLEVSHPAAPVIQVDPPPQEPLDLYDPCVVRFTKAKATRGTPRGSISKAAFSMSDEANISLRAAPGTEIVLEHPQSGHTETAGKEFSGNVTPGTYSVKVRERGATIHRRTLTVNPGETKVIDLLERPMSEVKANILATVSHSPEPGLADFSETLGAPMANWDLGLWLSIFGASHILAGEGRFSMLSPLPLETFKDVEQGDSLVYVLAGFEKTEGKFAIALSDGPTVEWHSLRAVAGLGGIYEGRLPATEGCHLLSFRMPGLAPLTLAVCCLANRATFVTFAEGEDGNLSTHQFLLPIHKLFKYLEEAVVSRLDSNRGGNPLKAVRSMCLAQNLFARKRSPDPRIEDWIDLMNGEWLDPIMSVIAAYDVIRRGDPQQRLNMDVVVNKLRRYFGGVPDIEVIARLLGQQWQPLKAAPLLLDGVLALEGSEEDLLPLSLDKLDYSGPWTMWRGAVK